MGRPKKDCNKDALLQIEDAFWQLLETMPYSKITIQKLADTAGVHRNAVYYHFENVDDVAVQTIASQLHSADTGRLIRVMMGDFNLEQFQNPGSLQLLHRLLLLARSDSEFLQNLLKDAIVGKWLGELQVDSDQLTPIDRMCIEFTISGIIALMASNLTADNPKLIFQMPNTEIGAAARNTMRRISGMLPEQPLT